MENINFENQKKERHFLIISQNLSKLLSNIKNIPLGDEDYELLSRSFTREVSDYIRGCLIKPLTDAQNRINDSQTPTNDEAVEVPHPSSINPRQKNIVYISNIQEIFDSLKELQYLDPMHYETILRNNPGIISALTDFTEKLEASRKRRIAKK